MLLISQTALELGFLYALVAMALFLSYRILDIADLTTDGCFVLGAAVSVTTAAAGHPVAALFCAVAAGACAGFVTAFLQTRLGVPSILAGIVTNTGLYTINLMAMGWSSNKSLLASSVNTNFTVTLGLCVANSLTALSGAMVGQYQKTVDINSGTGIVVIGLACLIIGETVLGRRTVLKGIIAVVLGSVIYRFIYAIVFYTKIVPVDFLKLITALVVAAAIAAPTVKKQLAFQRQKAAGRRKGAKGDA